ncbi:MAG: MotA/TolQ/ExbB proton channel family protein [bacterium]|nr:MotA/TolQ/ExbB proton channel family protein [bacterium]
MIAGINLFEIMKISPVFDILFACSALALGVSLERLWTFHYLNMNLSAFMEKVRLLMANKKYAEVVEACDNENKPLPKMLRVGAVNITQGRKNITKLMEAQKLSEREALERFLPILGTLGNTAPFIGLLGTVIGIIRSFKLLQTSASAGPMAIMVGIAEALITTAMGLVVAVPCVILFNYFSDKVKRVFIEMEIASKEFITMVPKLTGVEPPEIEIIKEPKKRILSKIISKITKPRVVKKTTSVKGKSK